MSTVDSPSPEQPSRPAPTPNRSSTWPAGRGVGVAAATLVLGAVGGWFVGQSGGGDSGPTTFSEAMQQFQSGDLPAGDATNVPGGAAGQGGAVPGGDGQGAPGQAPGGLGGVIGTITANDGTTLTVETADGDVEVTITGDTAITKTVDGTAGDLADGTTVRVQTTDDSNGTSGGSVTAASIAQVDPESVPAGGFPGAPGGSPAGSPD